jgi:hypothetical protein
VVEDKCEGKRRIPLQIWSPALGCGEAKGKSLSSKNTSLEK